MSEQSFQHRLSEEFEAGRRLCVGIDPHESVLNEWGLPDNALSAEFLGREMIQAAHGQAACVKPQIAFFERFGAQGYLALERVLQDARDANLLIIADVKRGDIGSSFQAYADAWLRPGSPLEADAMTVHAYQGFDTLSTALDHVVTYGKGLFVLAATSNPEAAPVQQAHMHGGETLAAHMVARAQEFNREHATATVGGVGVVLGATVTLHDMGIDTQRTPKPHDPVLPVLAPGFGFQGATIHDAIRTFGEFSPGLIVSESRSLMGRGNRGITKRVRTSAEAIIEAYSKGTDE